MITTAKPEIGNYVGTFADFERNAAGHELHWLSKLRRDAFARFYEVGFPTTRDEDWRFTDISAIANTTFRLARGPRPSISREQLSRWSVEGFACQLVWINGRYAPELSRTGDLPVGVKVGGLAETLRTGAEQSVEKHLARYLDQRRDSFSALNTAFAEDGAFVHIPRATVLEQPIHLLFISASEHEPLMYHPRNLIVAEEDSQVTIVEEYVSLNDELAFCNTVTELVADDNSVVSHFMIERENTSSLNVSTLRIQQGRSANVASHSILTGGALVRNNVHPILAGEGGECLINGLFFGRDRQHMDNYMLVEHASPRCESRQFYNGILDDHAHGVFHGRIIVHKDAQKTDAKQTNRNLLLSDGAQIDTKPQLEIHADDVKCTHGATIGQIEEDALFYLRSRGIDEVSARKLLLLAFANECVERMKQGPARTLVENLVNDYLLRVSRADRRRGAA